MGFHSRDHIVADTETGISLEIKEETDRAGNPYRYR
jgi:hypothetical protein